MKKKGIKKTGSHIAVKLGIVIMMCYMQIMFICSKLQLGEKKVFWVLTSMLWVVISNGLKQHWKLILSPFPLTLSEPGVMQPAGKAVSISALPNAPHSLKQDEHIFCFSYF